MKINYHNSDIRNTVDISGSVLVLLKEPHKFGDDDRVFIVAINPDGRRFANTVWVKEENFESSLKISVSDIDNERKLFLYLKLTM